MPTPDHKRRLVAFFAAMAVLIATPLAVVASDRFSDVPGSNVFHNDIGWLADAGITLGCNPPANTEYCPEDPVQRQQMAAFMRRFAQYLDAEDGTPGEADTVEGFTSAELMSTVDGMSRDGASGGNVLNVTDPTAVFTMPVDAAKGAYALADYGYYAGSDVRFFTWLQYNDATCVNGSNAPGTLYFQEPGSGELATVNGSTVLATAGVTSITMCADTFLAASVGIRDAHLNVLYVQDGSTSVELAGAGSGGVGPDIAP